MTPIDKMHFQRRSIAIGFNDFFHGNRNNGNINCNVNCSNDSPGIFNTRKTLKRSSVRRTSIMRMSVNRMSVTNQNVMKSNVKRQTIIRQNEIYQPPKRNSITCYLTRQSSQINTGLKANVNDDINNNLNDTNNIIK